MKTCLASIIFLLVGLAIGFYAGNRSYHKHMTDEAIARMEEQSESYDAVMASFSTRTISLIDAGQDKEVVQLLSYPIASYYYVYGSSRFTNEQRLKLRAIIDGLASSNKVVAAQIAETMTNK